MSRVIKSVVCAPCVAPSEPTIQTLPVKTSCSGYTGLLKNEREQPQRKPKFADALPVRGDAPVTACPAASSSIMEPVMEAPWADWSQSRMRVCIHSTRQTFIVAAKHFPHDLIYTFMFKKTSRLRSHHLISVRGAETPGFHGNPLKCLRQGCPLLTSS